MKNIIKAAMITTALVLSTVAAQANTTNLLFNETTEHPFGAAKPVLLDDFIIYQTHNDQGHALWSYHTESGENTQIFSGELNDFSSDEPLHVVGNRVYFSSGSELDVRFWQTDGTVNGTAVIDSPPLLPVHSISNGLLFSWSNAGFLVSTNGAEVVVHDIDNPVINNICAFDNNDVIAVQEDNENSNGAIIQRSRNGVVTTLSTGFPETFQVSEGNSILVGESCFLLIHGENGFRELMVVPKDGAVKLLSERMALDEVASIFTAYNRIYSVSNLSENTYQYAYKRFNPALNVFDATYELPLGFSTGRPKITSEYIMGSASTPNVSPRISKLFFLDENLNQVEGLGGTNTRIPTLYPLADGDLFGGYDSVAGANAFTLSESPNYQSDPLVHLITYNVEHVISSTTNDAVYLMMRKSYTHERSVHMVSETPDINSSTAGVWFNPSINNQGLVINTGLRANGSHYLFVTVYTYIDGEPFWLAGVENIVPPQKQIELTLFEHSGSDFLQPDEPSSQAVWGSVTLTMTACNQLNVTLTEASGTDHIIDLVRIDNTEFNLLCIE